MMSKKFLKFQMESPGILILMIVGQIVTILILMCSRDQAKKVPNNYIILTIYTVCQSYLVGFICGLSSPKIVFMAAVLTLAIFFALTLYACTTKTDFTM